MSKVVQGKGFLITFIFIALLLVLNREHYQNLVLSKIESKGSYFNHILVIIVVNGDYTNFHTTLT